MPEQIFVEKLKTMLRLGPISNRAKDVDDLLFLSSRLDIVSARHLIKSCIFNDPNMFENDMEGIIKRVERTFADPLYFARLSHRRSNWLQVPPEASTKRILEFLRSL